MYLVAIAQLHEGADDLSQLAFDLGVMLYDLKLALSAGIPAVVLATTDESRAAAAAEAIDRQGHRAVSCDRRALVAGSAMVALRDFRFEADALVAGSTGELLPYEDLSVLLRASHRTTQVSTEVVKERKLTPGRAIVTGGLMLSKSTQKEVVSHTTSHEQVLYLFRSSGATPWILRERSARYTGLGAELRPTSVENIGTVIRLLRERAPRAPYDERLMRARPIRGVAEGVEACDILAQLLAKSLAR